MPLESSVVQSVRALEQEPSNPGQEVQRSYSRNTFSVLILDIDHFRKYNDTHGHPAGNELLQALAGILQTILRTTDFPARLDGDVFAVMLPETSAQGAMIVAERIRTAFAAHPGKQSVSLSIGISSKKKTTLDADQVVYEAEQALMVSKKLGRNCVIHYDLTQAAVCLPETFHHIKA